MPPLETRQPPPQRLPPPNQTTPSKSFVPIILSLVLLILAVVSFLVSKKSPKLKWVSLVFVIGSVASAAYFFLASPSSSSKIKPVPAPTGVEKKIQGYWGTRLFLVTAAFETDIEKMKEVGINTITMAPQLEHKGDGKITDFPGTEDELKRAINKAHESGFRVVLDPAPMTTEFNPKTEDPDLFSKNMRKVTLKYAKLAEEFNVEYYSPLTEPVAQLGSVRADKFMHDILPEIKKRYKGKVVFKKQSNDIEEFKNIEEDHITEIEFMITGYHFGVSLRATQESAISLGISSDRVSLTRFIQGSDTRIDKKQLTVAKNEWHNLRIEQKGKLIAFYLDNQPLFEYEDNQGAYGSYNLNSGGVTVRKFTIKDLRGKSLISEGNVGDNWSGFEGWSIEKEELVGQRASNPAKFAGQLNLIHDIDFSGYDMIAIHLWKEGTVQSLADYRQEVKYKIKKTRQQADSDHRFLDG